MKTFKKPLMIRSRVSLYPCAQWAAVTIHFFDRIEHPQKWFRNRCIEHWKGAAPSGASSPPTMRVEDTSGG